MKYRKCLYISELLFLLLFIQLSCWAGWNVPDVRKNGWVYPVSDYRSYEECSGFKGYPGHVGVDICRQEETSIFAIADGCVEDYGMSISGYGGTSGQKGGAVLLRHKARSGKVFYALYGHGKLNVSYLEERRCKGGEKSITKGEKVATIHEYIDGWDHIHFGIRQNSPEEAPYQFRGNNCFNDPKNCGWEDPFQFLNDNSPASPITSCAWINATQQVCWRSKDCIDLSCEHATDRWIRDNGTGQCFSSAKAVCPTQCSAQNQSLLLADFSSIGVSYSESEEASYSFQSLAGCGVPDITNPDTTPKSSGVKVSPGKRSNIIPDLDVYHEDGHEVSADCHTCKTEPLIEGQKVRISFKMRVENDGAKDHLRIKDREKVGGKIWYLVSENNGMVFQGWQELANFDISIDRLGNGRSPDEEVVWRIPDMPDKVITVVDCVDTDDEVWEEGEDKERKQVTSPENCGTDNISRKERFRVLPETRIPCDVIDRNTWISEGWSKLPYAPPFDLKESNSIRTFCRINKPSVVEVTVGNAGNSNIIVYRTVMIRENKTGSFVPYQTGCEGWTNGVWCQGTVNLVVEQPGVDTSAMGEGTQFLFYTCEASSSGFVCANNWQLQVLRLPY